MMKKLMIIGQAPSRESEAKRPFMGRSGRRLANLMGVTFSRFVEMCDLENLNTRWTGKEDKGDRFNVRIAEKRATLFRARIQGAVMEGRGPKAVILVGREVGRIFSMREYFEKMDLLGTEFYMIPHPSGINRWYNEAHNTIFMERFFRKLLLKIGERRR